MENMGSIIRNFRKARGCTQDEMAQYLNVTYQAVSKWENGAALPDVSLIPSIAAFLRVTTDELFGYTLHVMTNKEALISMMVRNRILCRDTRKETEGNLFRYYINSENFTTNAQLYKLGEVFADRIREEHFQFDALAGLAYHGIALAAATAVSLYYKYGISVPFFCDRRTPDKRGRMICGYTPKNGERILLIDDTLSTGKTMVERIERLKEQADVEIEGALVILNEAQKDGMRMINETYGAKVCSLITDEDIQMAILDKIIVL
ncbi:MAG: helix-turn-helix domain-containing protein [Clostridiales bacterium]|nr:helix-turn-helix domain-containing protein [Clostridiales bacterium]